MLGMDPLRAAAGGIQVAGAAEWTGMLVNRRAALAEMKDHIAPVFGRPETQAPAVALVGRLLSSVEPKTRWMLAEQAGFARPFRIQSMLGRSA